MGVTHHFCGRCDECFHEDYFRHCAYCEELFDCKVGGYVCDNHDSCFKRKITFEGKEYDILFHSGCFKSFSKESIEEQKEILENSGQLDNSCPLE